jgi:hypothetical protein
MRRKHLMNRTTRPLSHGLRRARGSVGRLARIATLSAAAAGLGSAVLAVPAHAAASPAPNIQVAIVNMDVPAMAGDDLSVVTAVTNSGQLPAYSVQLHVAIDPAVGGSIGPGTTSGPGACRSDGSTGVFCSLGTVAPGDLVFSGFTVSDAGGGSFEVTAAAAAPGDNTPANNVATAHLTVQKYASATAAAAPASVRAGQPTAVPVRVRTLDGPDPDGSVTVVGPDGVFAAPLKDGVAYVPYVAARPGRQTVAVAYSGSRYVAASSTAVTFDVL